MRSSRRSTTAAAPDVDDLVHHSDRGTQYLSMRYTERLAEAGIAPSVGSRGDSYDNALAESIIGLFKTEVIQRQGPWRHLEAVEFATLAWVDWFNTADCSNRLATCRRPNMRRATMSRCIETRPSRTCLTTGALGGILSPASQSLAQAADRLHDVL